MGVSSAEMALLGSAVVLGLRHGVDYDHIAAITDITGMQRRPLKGVLYSGMYALGHGAVVMLLIALAVTAGAEVPKRLDEVMGRAVGLTLVVLSAVVLYSLARAGSAGRPLSRGMLLIQAARSAGGMLSHFVGRHHHHHHRAPRAGYGPVSCFGTGVIHGIGAETPSQLVLVVLAAGFTSVAFGLLVGAVFVAGVIATNMGMSLALGLGSGAALRRPWVYRSLMTASALYSLVMGVIFVGGLGSHLPALI